MLSAFSFEVVALEKLSFDEKVKLYCEAELIVAPYGGSLVPCVFANKGTTIIELSSIAVPLTGWEHYKKICKAIGVRYYGYHNINYQDAHFNIHVKLDELYKLLSELTRAH
jgi:capsular polysaccharide biosynthesis protein